MVDLLKRGSVAGFSAGVTVAAGVLVYDLFNLQPLATPDALARNLMGGPVLAEANLGVVEWVASVVRRSGAFLGYTIVHFAIFVGLGILGAMTFQPGRIPGNVLTGGLFGAIIGTGVFSAGHAALAPSFVGVPSLGLVAAINAAAGVVLVAQLMDEHGSEGDPSVV